MAESDIFQNYRNGFVAESDEELDLPAAVISEKDSSASESETEEVLNVFRRKQKKKAGKKSSWPVELTDELVDVICSDEYFRKKLIFTNTRKSKNGEIYLKVVKEVTNRCQARGEEYKFSVVQTRNKFKKCISECKKAALTCKSASGIKRFQEDKDYGKWFNQLLPYIKSRESCQPEQAVEPSASIDNDEIREGATDSGTSTPSPTSSSSASFSGKSLPPKKKAFIPIKGTSAKKQELEELVKVTSQAIADLSEQLKKDPMADMLGFFERENERAREHELRLFSMMFNGNQAFPQPPNQAFPQPPNQTFNQNWYQSYLDPRRQQESYLEQENFSTRNQNLANSQQGNLYQL